MTSTGRNGVEHAKLCHEARLDILNRLTDSCKSESIDSTQLLSVLPPINDTSDVEDDDDMAGYHMLQGFDQCS